MSTLTSQPRRALFFRLSVIVGLGISLLQPVARAMTDPPPVETASGPSSVADQTWGVWPTPDGRAPRVRALAVVGRAVFLGGDFTTMVPPGSPLPKPTTTTTSSTATTSTTAPSPTSTTAHPTTSTTAGPTATTTTIIRPATVTPALEPDPAGLSVAALPTTTTTTTAAPATTTTTAAPATTSTTGSPPTTTTTTRPSPPPPPPPGSQTRRHLAALDVDNHTLLPWNPDADGPVHAIVVSADGTQLYVGGDFDHIGGQPVAKLARIDVATGAVDPTFHPRVQGGVRALALAGDRLYVGGVFNYVVGPAGGEARPKLAALDATTGALLPWTPPAIGPGRYTGHNGTPTPSPTGGDVLALAVPADQSLVYAAGNFMDFGGQAGLAVFDATTGQLAPAQWKTGRPIFDLAVSPADGETVFASAGGSGGEVYAFRPDQPKGPVWSTWVDGDAPGVAASASTVFLMGHYDYAGHDNALRHHLAAFDAGDGAVDSWNPTANTPWGAFSAAVGAGHVFVGGEFTRINGQPQPGFAQFTLPPPPPPTTTTVTTTTSTTTTTTTTATTTTVKPKPTTTTTAQPTVLQNP